MTWGTDDGWGDMFSACCPHCDGGPFDCEDEYFEHVSMCPDAPDAEDGEE